MKEKRNVFGLEQKAVLRRSKICSAVLNENNVNIPFTIASVRLFSSITILTL